jgi:hypothetical protein
VLYWTTVGNKQAKFNNNTKIYQSKAELSVTAPITFQAI